MNQAPHIENGFEDRCPCGAVLHVGFTADGVESAAHAHPFCLRYAEMHPTAFLFWLHDVRRSSPVPAVIARLEQRRAAGRLSA